MKKTKELCAGCYNDDYNHGLGGAKECWCFEDAKVCKKKKIHINDVPPWKHQRTFNTLDCYRKPQYVYVEPSQLC